MAKAALPPSGCCRTSGANRSLVCLVSELGLASTASFSDVALILTETEEEFPPAAQLKDVAGRTNEEARSNLFFRFVSNAEVDAIRVVKHQRADACFRVHHEAFRELHADVLRL